MLQERPDQNNRTFLKSRPYTARPFNDESCFGVVGIPFGGATSYRSGQNMAPNAIRDASAMLTDGSHPEFDVDPSHEVVDHGDIIVGNDIKASLSAIETFFSNPCLAQSNRPLFALGGDHLVTLGILRGLRRHPEYTSDMRLLIFDAHADTWKDNFGSPKGHGTWVRNVVEEHIVQPKNIMQVGLRSPIDPETRRWLPDQGGYVFSARGIRRPEDDGLDISTALRRFTGTSAPLYVSIDIDVLDPSCAPGTGTPEMAGLSSATMQDFLECDIDYHNLLGVDVVEVLPAYDRENITALAAATMIWSIMSKYLYARR